MNFTRKIKKPLLNTKNNNNKNNNLHHLFFLFSVCSFPFVSFDFVMSLFLSCTVCTSPASVHKCSSCSEYVHLPIRGCSRALTPDKNGDETTGDGDANGMENLICKFCDPR